MIVSHANAHGCVLFNLQVHANNFVLKANLHPHSDHIFFHHYHPWSCSRCALTLSVVHLTYLASRGLIVIYINDRLQITSFTDTSCFVDHDICKIFFCCDALKLIRGLLGSGSNTSCLVLTTTFISLPPMRSLYAVVRIFLTEVFAGFHMFFTIC